MDFLRISGGRKWYLVIFPEWPLLWHESLLILISW
jgi:hypothetical protein